MRLRTADAVSIRSDLARDLAAARGLIVAPPLKSAPQRTSRSPGP
jgi:hypothetical protein